MNAANTRNAGGSGKPDCAKESPELRRLAQVVFDLLLATDWLAKCDVVARERPLLDAMRAVLREESRLAWERGGHEDARLYAAHVALLDDIEQRGLGPVQAEIIRAAR